MPANDADKEFVVSVDEVGELVGVAVSSSRTPVDALEDAHLLITNGRCNSIQQNPPVNRLAIGFFCHRKLSNDLARCIRPCTTIDLSVV